MQTETLTNQALQVINDYLNLNIADKNIQTPYFNNRRKNIRGALRVLIGKGSPEDISEEAIIFSLREKIDLKNLSTEDLKKYLIDHNLGIDCSGLIYHVLDAELKAKNFGGLKKYIHRPWIKNPLRKLIAQFRSAENTGVSTFNNDINSEEINLKDIQPGDLIIMMGAGPKQDYNHVLLVHSIVHSPLSIVHYTHSFQYPTDGLYNHGVRQEKIEIVNQNNNLLEQNWSEPQMQEYAKKAKAFKLRRIKI